MKFAKNIKANISWIVNDVSFLFYFYISKRNHLIFLAKVSFCESMIFSLIVFSGLFFASH